MLVEYPPTVQLSKLVNSLKAVTSRRLRNEFLDLREAYSKPVLWSRSYFVGSCGGAPLEVVKRTFSTSAAKCFFNAIASIQIPLPPATVGVPFETKDGRKWVIQESNFPSCKKSHLLVGAHDKSPTIAVSMSIPPHAEGVHHTLAVVLAHAPITPQAGEYALHLFRKIRTGQ
jgi:hypothetical protein